MFRKLLVCLLLLAISGSSFAQPRGRWGRNRRTIQIDIDRRGVPDWDVDEEFPNDVFTFVRVRYNDYGGGWGKWVTDYPDSDLNFSFRLQQLTSLRVTPDPIILDLSDPAIFDYPFLYIIEPGGYDGGLNLRPQEVETLRRYLDNGGFVMVDDFWGEDEWQIFYEQIKQVFPDTEPVELSLDHPIFHCVYELKEKPQVPSITAFQQGRRSENWDNQGARYLGFFNEAGHLQMIVCHNTDLGDGWEREGEDPWYFREFSEKKAYPLGINIVVYAMTH
jgi:Domain of unknown function (DUF4159)